MKARNDLNKLIQQFFKKQNNTSETEIMYWILDVQLDNKFVLFRNIEYGKKNLNVQYCSDDPLNFGIDTDSLLVGELHVAAPEIVNYKNEYYLFSLKETLDGIKAVKISFEEP